jgi:hypothetical protein
MKKTRIYRMIAIILYPERKISSAPANFGNRRSWWDTGFDRRLVGSLLMERGIPVRALDHKLDAEGKTNKEHVCSLRVMRVDWQGRTTPGSKAKWKIQNSAAASCRKTFRGRWEMKTTGRSTTIPPIFVGKWTGYILFSLHERPYRHGQLQRRLRGSRNECSPELFAISNLQH